MASALDMLLNFVSPGSTAGQLSGRGNQIDTAVDSAVNGTVNPPVPVVPPQASYGKESDFETVLRARLKASQDAKRAALLAAQQRGVGAASVPSPIMPAGLFTQ